MKKLIVIAICVILTGCSATLKTKLVNKNYQPLPETTKVFVLESAYNVPFQSELIGDIKIGDSGFSVDCGYDKMISEAKNLARKAGANIIKITEINEPNFFASSCYRMRAKIYRNTNEEVLVQLDDKNRSRLPEGADYAVVYFYRPSIDRGSLIGYKVNVENDSVIGRVRDGEKFEYRTKKFGKRLFYGQTESHEEVIIDVQKGQEYYVRCGIKTGAFVGRPELTAVENYIGRKEYTATK